MSFDIFLVIFINFGPFYIINFENEANLLYFAKFSPAPCENSCVLGM